MSEIKTMVRGAYDIQKLRIQTGNRIVANYKVKLGQEPSKPEKDLSADAKRILADLRAAYERITDGISSGFPRRGKFQGNEIISSYTELSLIAHYFELQDVESTHFRRLGVALDDYPIYTGFLKNVKGVGPAMAGVIVSEIDIRRAEYPSSLWKYAGLDVAANGGGRSRKKEHLEKVSYINSAGEEAERNSITFNPFLKTKLIGVLASSFLRAGDNPYRKVYDDYKHRLENSPRHQEKTKGHRHNMALRYMIKRFLVDLYVAWRRMEGLPVAEEYSAAKLGKVHKIA